MQMAATQTLVFCDYLFLGHVIFEFPKEENKNGQPLVHLLEHFLLTSVSGRS